MTHTKEDMASDPMCADCGGWDIEWMRQCHKHKGVQFCRGCSCPYCEDPDDEPEPDSFRTLGLRQSDFL